MKIPSAQDRWTRRQEVNDYVLKVRTAHWWRGSACFGCSNGSWRKWKAREKITERISGKGDIKLLVDQETDVSGKNTGTKNCVKDIDIKNELPPEMIRLFSWGDDTTCRMMSLWKSGKMTVAIWIRGHTLYHRNMLRRATQPRTYTGKYIKSIDKKRKGITKTWHQSQLYPFLIVSL